jgi:5-methylcytosine-specific restriction endonuclease McrA
VPEVALRAPGSGGSARVTGAPDEAIGGLNRAAVEPAALIAVALPPRLRDHDVTPLTAEKSRLHVTVSSRFLAKLEAVKAALSHSHPRATAQDLLEAGLDLLLQRAAKRRGLVERPRKSGRAPSKPDRVPAHVRREVWKRDGGRCQWPVASGGVCGSTTRVELDHSLPRARGGPPTVENLRLLCRSHNDLAAREIFGNAWMDRFTNPRRRDRPPVAR